MITKGRAPADRGQGRKTLTDDVALTAVIHVRVTELQRDKLAALGGGKWFRDRIDRAKEPSA